MTVTSFIFELSKNLSTDFGNAEFGVNNIGLLYLAQIGPITSASQILRLNLKRLLLNR